MTLLKNTEMTQCRNEGIEPGIAEGIEKEIEQGIFLEKLAIAKTMLAKDFDLKMIGEIIGLTEQTLLSAIQKPPEDSRFVETLIRKYSAKKDYAAIQNKTLHFELGQRKYTLVRLRDEQYDALGSNSLAIEERHYGLSYYLFHDSVYAHFAKAYLTLKMLFGESGNCYDDWKGSYAFPFLIYFQIAGEEFVYLMNVCNWRSCTEFRIRKVIHAEDTQFTRGVYHKPFAEFSGDEMTAFIGHFAIICNNFFKTLNLNECEPFVKKIESQQIVYGYDGEQFFKERYDNDEDEDENENEDKFMAVYTQKKNALNDLHTAKMALLKLQLEQRFEKLPHWVEEKLATATTIELKNWQAAIAEAKTLESLFLNVA